MNMACSKILAYDFEVDGIYYNVVSISDLTCEIAPYYGHESNYSGDFVIPNEVTYNGRKLKVIRIGDYAFANSPVTSVTIPSGVISIGYESFYKCKNMVYIDIPNTVATIGDTSFYECSSLVSISLPVSVSCIARQAFAYCTSLTQITIPDSVPSIEEYTFRGCSALKNVSIPQCVTTIGESAFEKCSALTTIDLPKGLKEIGKSAFLGCSALKSIKIPASCEGIRNYAFNGCEKLKDLVIEDGSTPLLLGFSYVRNDNAKYYHDLFNSGYGDYKTAVSLSTLYIGRITKRAMEWLPNQGSGFSDNAYNSFWGSNLNSVTIGDMITDEIYNCSESRYLFNLLEQRYNNIYVNITPFYRHITFGKGITTVPDLSFNTKLDSIVVLNNTPPSAVAFANTTYLHCKLYVPKGCKSVYESADVWKNFWNILEIGEGSGGINPDQPYTKKCQKPIISYTDGRLTFSCDTEGAKCISEIKDVDIKKYYDHTINLKATYEISVYAMLEGYNNSDVATATLVWTDATFTTKGKSVAKNMKMRPLLIQSDNGMVNIQGLENGTEATLYNISGQLIGSANTINNTTSISTLLKPGEEAILKVGNRSINLIMR